MNRFILGRVLSGMLTLLLFVTLLFFIVSYFIPGDWTHQFLLTGEQREALQEQLGIDRPWWEQFWEWISGAVTLDFGHSFSGPPVWDLIRESLPSTITVLIIGAGAAFLLGAWVGRMAAYTSNRFLSGLTTFFAVLALTAFPPAIAFTIENFAEEGVVEEAARRADFDTTLHLFSEFSPIELISRMTIIAALSALVVGVLAWLYRKVRGKAMPVPVLLVILVGLPFLLWAFMGVDGAVLQHAVGLGLLIIGVVILTFGEVVVVTKAAMDDSVHEDYVHVARAKGLPERRIRDHHAARAALLPILSRFTVSIPYFLTGLAILEAVFGGVGLGTLIFDAVAIQDTPVIVGSLLVVGVLTLVLRIILDVLHAALDPRIRIAEAAGGG
ncbi:MAG: ABC transporter permease [Acidimicrobiia bacterium]|nr:ABC transporter permease [Acidimicrobiia bacterium]